MIFYSVAVERKQELNSIKTAKCLGSIWALCWRPWHTFAIWVQPCPSVAVF